MNNLLPIIQKLVDMNFFAPTKSALAKSLGRKDKNIFYDRLYAVTADGQPMIGQSALDTLCKDLCVGYGISEYTLSHLIDIWELAHVLAEQCTTADFVPLVRKRFSSIKDTELQSELRSLSKASALDYGYMLALFYVFTRHLDPNAQKNTHVLIETTQQVDALLRQYYPENRLAHNLAKDIIDQARAIKLIGWCNLMCFVGRLICIYSNPSVVNELAADFTLLPIGETSWWMAANADGDQATLYSLWVDSDSSIYYVLVVDADRNADFDATRCRYNRWVFMFDGNLLRCVEPEKNKLAGWGYYNCKYEEVENRQLLYLCPNTELNGAHISMSMPDTLVRIKHDSPWGKWVASLDEDTILEVMARLEVESMGLEDTDYEVKDVILNRYYCTLQYALPGQTIEVATLPYDKYPLLKKVSVWDDVYILRDPVGHHLYAHWLDDGLVIPIK